jgi:hypothetical protein
MQRDDNEGNIFYNEIILLFNYCIKIKENSIFLYNYIKDFYELKSEYTIIPDEKYDIENNITISHSYNDGYSIDNIDASVFYNIGNALLEDSWEVVIKKDT